MEPKWSVVVCGLDDSGVPVVDLVLWFSDLAAALKHATSMVVDDLNAIMPGYAAAADVHAMLSQTMIFRIVHPQLKRSFCVKSVSARKSGRNGLDVAALNRQIEEIEAEKVAAKSIPTDREMLQFLLSKAATAVGRSRSVHAAFLSAALIAEAVMVNHKEPTAPNAVSVEEAANKSGWDVARYVDDVVSWMINSPSSYSFSELAGEASDKLYALIIAKREKKS